jgi:hypothetical protein
MRTIRQFQFTSMPLEKVRRVSKPPLRKTNSVIQRTEKTKMTTNNSPKLEIGLNAAATLKLLKDKHREGINNVGPQYVYSVDHDGPERVFFATAEIHQKILQDGLKSGNMFSTENLAV